MFYPICVGLGQDFDGDRPNAPLAGLAAGGHPNVNLLFPPFSIHPIFDGEYCIPKVFGNPDFSAEWQAIGGDGAGVDLSAGSGRERVAIGLVLG